MYDLVPSDVASLLHALRKAESNQPLYAIEVTAGLPTLVTQLNVVGQPHRYIRPRHGLAPG